MSKNTVAHLLPSAVSHVGRSLACGLLRSTTTVCLYLLPPSGPTQLDYLLMSALSSQTTLLPVISKADTLSAEEAQRLQLVVAEALQKPELHVKGLPPGPVKKLVAGNR